MGEKKFNRQKHKLKKLGDSWRRPRGHHSKLRLGKAGKGRKPSPSYGSPDRGRHPSGYYEVLVRNEKDLEDIDEDEEAARLSSRLGKKKKERIREKAEEKEIKILN
ncbi:hypothetical protein AKJ51_04535 [candidate division MSBL1 archaeon SCGC-AAA382A20]|uniref:Uncharacterized protein n=1 Tax=candidate division MSBL1 archaeon SCGC-AAA382A20 TaxID=1698280 RepID=A0A133VHL0_9EURY|nr:hypothetical protein AKJ51_04535 [candidate division MSBL1 archaeon SCGC-AAA382A20]